MSLQFFVPGVPAPGGSKNAYINKHTGRPTLVDAGKNNAGWKQRVAVFASQAMVGRVPMGGPLRVRFFFSMPRPKGHFGTGRNRGELKKSAPLYHTIKPDATKLVRSAEDACTGIVWTDDAVIAEQWAQKCYALSLPGRCTPGVLIEVTELEP